jgi:hypothetical protein
VADPLIRYRLHDTNVIGAVFADNARRQDRAKRGGFLRRSVRHFRIRRDLAQRAEGTLRHASIACPAPLLAVAQGGIGCFVYMLLQAVLLLVKLRARMSAIAFGSAVGCLYEAFAYQDRQKDNAPAAPTGTDREHRRDRSK